MTRKHIRTGFTLFEVILVVAIIVIAAAIAVPTLSSMQGSHRVQGAVDSVRAAWATARAAATEQSRSYRFAVEPGGRHFRVAPDEESYWSGGSGPAGDPVGPGRIVEGALPPGVRFVINGEPGQQPPEPTAAEAAAPASGQWETACVFRHDGTAQEDVRIVFQVRGAAPMQLELRGLTGIATSQRLTGR